MKIKIEQEPTRRKALLVLRIERANGEIEETRIPNSRTDAGALWIHNRLTGLGTTGAGVFVAVSRNAQDIQKGMTTLTSEYTGAGLARAAAAVQNYVLPATLDGPASYTLVRTAVYSNITTDIISSIGVFDALSGGSLIWVFNVSPSRVVNLNDRVIISIINNI